MNTKYIRSNKIKYLYSNNGYSVPDIRIYTEYMPNIQQTHTEYAPNIYSSSQFDRIWISNIFIQNKTNIHIWIQNIHLLIFEYSNNQIYLCLNFNFSLLLILWPAVNRWNIVKGKHCSYRIRRYKTCRYAHLPRIGRTTATVLDSYHHDMIFSHWKIKENIFWSFAGNNTMIGSSVASVGRVPILRAAVCTEAGVPLL